MSWKPYSPGRWEAKKSARDFSRDGARCHPSLTRQQRPNPRTLFVLSEQATNAARPAAPDLRSIEAKNTITHSSRRASGGLTALTARPAPFYVHPRARLKW
jgi:hypothetical protein